MKKVDLHIHSTYSDGTYSVGDIIEQCKKNQVGIFSITDHNVLKAYSEEVSLDDLMMIHGVEIDAHTEGLNVHILGYDFELDDEFSSFVNQINEKLEDFDDELLSKIKDDFVSISLEEYDHYQYDSCLGGWKSLNYLIEKGICHDLHDYFQLCNQYGHSNHQVDFPSALEVVEKIHEAHGFAVLAHPGKVIPYSTFDEFELMLRKIVTENHLDGIECYYPSHSNEITKICLQVCKDYDLMITCGSDCHGNFQKTQIGHINKSYQDLNITKLIENKKSG